jgi:hypothetical protein
MKTKKGVSSGVVSGTDAFVIDIIIYLKVTGAYAIV